MALLSPMSSSAGSEDARERARKASREIRRMKNDTSGGGARNILREHMMGKFIASTVHYEKAAEVDFADWLQDGTVLMDLMLTLSFNSVVNDPFGSAGEKPEVTRIRDLIQSIANYGIDTKYIFTVADLWEKKNTPKVTRCLEEIEKMAKQEVHVEFATMAAARLHR